MNQPPTQQDLATARELGSLGARVRACEGRAGGTDDAICRIDSRLRYLEIRVAGILVGAMIILEVVRWLLSGGTDP